MGECGNRQYAFNSVKPSDYGLNSLRSYAASTSNYAPSNYGVRNNNLYQVNNRGRYN